MGVVEVVGVVDVVSVVVGVVVGVEKEHPAKVPSASARSIPFSASTTSAHVPGLRVASTIAPPAMHVRAASPMVPRPYSSTAALSPATTVPQSGDPAAAPACSSCTVLPDESVSGAQESEFPALVSVHASKASASPAVCAAQCAGSASTTSWSPLSSAHSKRP